MGIGKSKKVGKFIQDPVLHTEKLIPVDTVLLYL
jgi:hypothetical protein